MNADALHAEGFLVTRFDSYDAFVKGLAILGRTTSVHEVSVKTGRSAMLDSSAAMPPHTDAHDVDWIAWYCHQQSDAGGASLLKDFRVISSKLSDECLQRLREIEVVRPNFDKKSAPSFHPLLTDRGIYYADWLVREPKDLELLSCLEKFRRALALTAPVHVGLTKGDALIVDNRRILHGREEIVERGTSRHLTRHWIVEN